MRIDPFKAVSPEFAGAVAALQGFNENLSKPEFQSVQEGLGRCMPLQDATVQAALENNTQDPVVTFTDLGPLGQFMIYAQFDPRHPRRIEINRNIAERVSDDPQNLKWRTLCEAKFVHELAHYLDRNHTGLVRPPNFNLGDDIGLAVEVACYGGHQELTAGMLAGAVTPGDAFVEVTERMPRGIRNHNPGNIEQGDDWQGLATSDQMTPFQKRENRFCVFQEPHWGLRALARVLRNYQSKHGLRTVRGMISRWAPPSENPTAAYVEAVSRAMGIGAGQTFDFGERAIGPSMIKAIIKHENGQQPYSDDQIRRGHAAGIA